ncbi:23S rRNA (guanosine(2251)-2'-O)-methyltransferase RlmB [Halorhodospira halophila]|uniref:23S rRNA (guanosine-2'-O-)-methyltransferase RlmB n=1 Tax=Halorhodospira halophila (strain DSM 244 / SL1) TaxID=349124 RepID=A1WUS8_HALHL|nr:23S rRNA (guanosine(2251)-2'-O)-methyltransferase RlmB [Halorhodospira halophila]ABM61440.1 23S rRNA Gm-2251 2'-O-methyltransferase [Halorhodospira halophila SL1]MBK1728687.1 23S rRNA (guanosine(2251)-2'-O)-methyltransferase RlmB [Halorhodospira halophila]
MAQNKRRRGRGARPAPADPADPAALVYGQHAAREAAAYDPAGVEAVWVEHGRRDARLERLLDKLGRQGVTVERVHRRVLDQMAEGGNHQGIVLRYSGTPARGEGELADLVDAEPEPLLLVLDRVQDPHNLGACMRSAAAAGAHGVVAPRDRAAALSPAVHKTAAGAVQRIPFFQVTNLARTLQQLRDAGVHVVGAAGEAEKSCYEVDLRGPLALVLGGEGEGLRRLTRERCDERVAIPMPGSMESLNVSVAAGVLLFEAVRQRFPQGGDLG